jgi:hypothetical protein
MNFVIFPMFFASSALYPLWRVREASLPLYWACMANPFTHAVELVRFALYLRFDPVSFAVVSCAARLRRARRARLRPATRHALPPGRGGMNAKVAAVLVAALALAGAAPLGADPDWPCVQRFVPRLAAAALWPGQPPGGDWRTEPEVAALVGRVAPRAVPEGEGIAAIERFAAPLDPDARRRLLPLAFAGALDETNRVRDGVVEQIRRFARRQRDLAEGVRRLEAEMRATPADAGPVRAELEQRHAFAAKSFTDAERTMRYACEAPVRLEGRLGAYARALAAALPND